MTTRLVFEQIILGRNITVDATISLRAEHMPSLFLKRLMKKRRKRLINRVIQNQSLAGKFFAPV